MKRALFLIIAALILGGWPSANMGGGTATPGGGGGGIAIVDTFTRSDNTDITTGCTGGDTCYWTEYGANQSIVSNALDTTASATWRVMNNTNAAAAADTTDQYVAAQFTGTVTGQNSGVVLLGETGSGDFAVIRFNSASNYTLRLCTGTATCSDADIATILNGDMGNGAAFATTDSLGMTVTGTGDAAIFTLYKWEAQAPPSDPTAWSGGRSICASGCDQAFSQLPSETGIAALPTGPYGGMYDGNTGGGATWDNWMFGDLP